MNKVLLFKPEFMLGGRENSLSNHCRAACLKMKMNCLTTKLYTLRSRPRPSPKDLRRNDNTARPCSSFGYNRLAQNCPPGAPRGDAELTRTAGHGPFLPAASLSPLLHDKRN